MKQLGYFSVTLLAVGLIIGSLTPTTAGNSEPRKTLRATVDVSTQITYNADRSPKLGSIISHVISGKDIEDLNNRVAVQDGMLIIYSVEGKIIYDSLWKQAAIKVWKTDEKHQ